MYATARKGRVERIRRPPLIRQFHRKLERNHIDYSKRLAEHRYDKTETAYPINEMQSLNTYGLSRFNIRITTSRERVFASSCSDLIYISLSLLRLSKSKCEAPIACARVARAFPFRPRVCCATHQHKSLPTRPAFSSPTNS